MYFAVARLVFDSGSPAGSAGVERRELQALTEKLRTRFKVCAGICDTTTDGSTTAIAITALASSEDRLSQTLDAIVSFCETAGLGRIEGEEALMDHVEALADYHAADND